MPVIYAFFGFIVLLAFGLALVTLRLCWRHTRFGALGAALAVLAVAALLFPLPIHGGFTILGEVLWNELAAQRDQVAVALDRSHDRAFTEHLEHRFAGDIAFRHARDLRPPWQLVEIGNGRRAFYQLDAFLVWSDLLTWNDAPQHPNLAAARGFCRGLAPEGYWDLPTEGELYFFWVAGGTQVSRGYGHRSMAVIIDRDLRLEVPTYYAGTRPEFALRCVALAPGAPRAGYSQQDVPREAWNRFQLDKTSLYLTGRN